MAKSSYENIYSRLPVWLQNVTCSVEGWILKKRRFTYDFYKHLQFLEQSYHWNGQQLEDYQERKLLELLDFAYRHIPYYRRLFQSLGLEPRDIKQLSDLKKLPLLEKETIRTQKESFISTSYSRNGLLKARTSGTTGKALVFYYLPETVAFEFASVWRFYNRMGIRIGDELAAFNARLIVPLKQNLPPFWRYNKAFNQTLFSQHHTNKSNIKFYIEELERFRRSYWQGYPSFIHLIAEEILELRGCSLANGPQVVFTSSETLFPRTKQLIEKATGAKVYNRYGLSEFCASMTECEQGNLHTDMEQGIIEVAPDNEDKESITGELICTGLHNYGTLFIRYRTGDIGTMLKNACPCGRQGQVFARIDGRIENYIITPEGARLGRMDHIFKSALNVKESQIIQQDIHTINVKIVPRPDYSKNDEAVLHEKFQLRLGKNMSVHFEYVDEIPRLPNGKFRAVISGIKQDASQT